jgi:TatD DNase family protein
MSLRLYDAHNHLQDELFGGRQSELLAACSKTGVVAMVVNGSCESDWPPVLELARRFPPVPPPVPAGGMRSPSGQEQCGQPLSTTRVLPSFGCHPWHLHERTPDWLTNLSRYLDEISSAVGEVGLDRWKPGLTYEGQEEAFIAQLRLAADRNLPVTIHCLQAWGRMLEILKAQPRPARGFLLHSYGGPREMVASFADLGAYFSLPGHFASERKARQREAFRHVPAERLLIETDAPDQRLPETQGCFGDAQIHPLTDAAGRKPLNHPANLAAVYAFAATLRGTTREALAAQVEANFLRLFGGR